MTHRKIKLIFFTIVLIFSVLLSVYSLFAYKQYHISKHQWGQKSDELARVSLEASEIQKSIDLFQADQKEFEKYLFQEQDIPSFLEGVSEYAAVSKVSIVDMKTTQFKAVHQETFTRGHQTRKKAGSKKDQEEQQLSLEQRLTLAAMPIKIQMKGTYQSFVHFLDRLENFKQLLTISHVEISSGRDYPQLTCQFTLKIYSLKTLNELAL